MPSAEPRVIARSKLGAIDSGGEVEEIEEKEREGPPFLFLHFRDFLRWDLIRDSEFYYFTS